MLQRLPRVQARVRRRVLRTFVRRGLIDKSDAEVMGGWVHGGGFSVDASVCIDEKDRADLERLLRYCARPPFALEHLQQLDADHLVYHSPKPGLDGSSDLVLTPLELIGKIAALMELLAIRLSTIKPCKSLVMVPPPRSHRHRYFGVLAPNSPLRAAVIALAPVAIIAPSLPFADSAGTEDKPRRAVSHYLWAMLLALIYEAFPLSCPICHAHNQRLARLYRA
jgi:hypothetical protein